MRNLWLALTICPIIALADEPPTVSEPEVTIPAEVTLDITPLLPIHIQPDFDVGSEVAFVYDLTAGESVYRKNSTQQMSIASITKMMTAFVVLNSNVDMDEVITLTSGDIALSNKGSARSKLHAGMRFTRERLLNLALMSSENRAAAALGRTTFIGGVSTFVDAMNETASKVLHMDNTHFEDPIGIGAGNVSTGEDLVKLITAASENDTIRDFSTTKWKEVELPSKRRRGRQVEYHNTNALVGFRDWNILVQKTGFTNAAGHCVVMVVDIQGHQYAVVELNAPNNQQRAFDAIKLRHWVEDGTELTHNEVQTYSPYQGFMLDRHGKLHPKRKHHKRSST